MIQLIAFYLFAAVVVASAGLTIFARNPVHSVLWLILAFFNAAGLMLLAGAEFIAMLLVIVYVGAVAVLFLFVVMMLDIDFAELRSGFAKYAPFGVLLIVGLAAEMIFAVGAWKSGPLVLSQRIAPPPAEVPNIEALGTLIKSMSVAQRIKLALFGNLAARNVLLRDTNKQIPLLVLENPRITENEISDISRNTQVDESVLRAVGNNTQWMKNYALKINLVSNPKTPIDIAMKWLKFIKDKDLQRLARSKNLSQVIATQSRKLLEQRDK